VPGIIGTIGTTFGKNNINVASVSFGRTEKGGQAVSVWNVDSPISKEVLDELKKNKNIYGMKLVKL
jgi:D-3-phosphoglycerate dehydrogenase